ncbi:hypothetical protein ASO20_00360 [Mycoplasma sp. (ex Biomphalaria glabrata)]|uniref:histidine--tRNA ligase n=1 Tax=Mycoplasma sp. (ex Biomphalaria glabrata) TaxID=1749074 RepID=UPI00073AC7FE|nr:histidine--tRNA ligase [Mycoplasma sp. (ex Biomphalaria glabrata)]ALV23134.1 hypothetical protein ASO20_00360 [Mycoplasma sp. (ex Biomphalaria glabrata)]
MIQKLRGMVDLYGKDGRKYEYIVDRFSSIAKNFGFEYIKTPVLEETVLFNRSIGNDTDIVSKEMYSFQDRGERNITLRPEGTASVVRSLLENKLYANLPQKFFYHGSMFRYERPQKGRQREFNQFGVETFGYNRPIHDVEIILLAYKMLESLGIKNLLVNINSLGTIEDRKLYLNELKKHLAPQIHHYCEDCQKRFQTNPLRILDCKMDAYKEATLTAPILLDYLNEVSKHNFYEVLNTLNELKISYSVDNKLVRGLDYYCDTIFEITSADERIGAQSTLVGGGRYNKLSEILGGKPLPSIGFAFGIERLMLLLDDEKFEFKTLDYFIINLTSNSSILFDILTKIRENNLSCDFNSNGENLKNGFRLAEKFNARNIILIGDQELKNKTLTIKNVEQKTQKEININDFYKGIKNDK